MVVGFNHNFTYKGAVYHIQTEDSGRKSPTIVTLLYCGGTILASRKTSYADITLVDNLEQVVEELMKEQHKGMLRSLKNGEFDEVIARYSSAGSGAPAAVTAGSPAPAAASPPQAESPPAASPALPRPQVPSVAAGVPSASTRPPTGAPAGTSRPAPPSKPAAVEDSLDEIILSYLMGEDK